MRNRLQRAFSEVRAGEELKAKTLEALYAPKRRRGRRPLMWAAACLAVLFCFGGGLFFTPVSAIGIEINPALRLRINRFDIVIGVEALNKDGRRVIEDTNLLFSEYSEAIDTLLADPEMRAYLEGGRDMEIFVECDDEQRCNRMLQKVEGCVGNEGNVTCHAGQGQGHGSGQGHGKHHRYRGGRGSQEDE